MAWYDTLFGIDREEKLNPAQEYYDNKIDSTREPIQQYERAYEELEIVNRGVNMIVDSINLLDVGRDLHAAVRTRRGGSRDASVGHAFDVRTT